MKLSIEARDYMTDDRRISNSVGVCVKVAKNEVVASRAESLVTARLSGLV